MSDLCQPARSYRARLRSLGGRAWSHVYADFLLPNRLAEYRDLLQYAIDQGYQTHSLSSFWSIARNRKAPAAEKYLIVRHDVDTAASCARRMWELERKLDARSSYYFRLKTADVALLKEMHASGFEASYHYEELSTVVKAKGLTEAEQAKRELPEMRALFKQNLQRLRHTTGLPMRTVAAHGDFVNSRLKVYNTIILEDQDLRREMDIDLEAYDDAMMRKVNGRYPDVTREYPRLWDAETPIAGFSRGEAVIYLLIHPEGWVPDGKANLLDNFRRLREELEYGVAVRRRGSYQTE